MGDTSENRLLRERAQGAALAHDYALAIRLYRSLLSDSPSDVSLLEALGDLYQKSGNDTQAVPLYKQIVNIQPQNTLALNSLGSIYRRLKKYPESIEALEKAVIADERNMQAFYNLGFTYKDMGKYDDAIQCFNTVIFENPNDVLAYNHLGSIYAEQGNYEKAVESYQKGLKIDQNHPILHLNQAKSYEKLGNVEQAESEYEAALRSKPGWLEAIDGLADLLLNKKKSSDAADLIIQAIRLNPQNASLHSKMGMAHSMQYDFNAAETDYNNALKLEPNNTEVLSALANVYEETGKNDKALSTMQQYEKLSPEDDDMLRQYAHVLMTAEKLDVASRKIKQLWNNNPDDVRTLNLLGQYYICRGEDEKAEGCFSRINAIDSDYKDYYKEGAKRYNQIGKYDKAESHIKKYLESNAEDSYAKTILASSYEKQNKYEEALETYKQLASKYMDNTDFINGVERTSNLLEKAISASTASLSPSDDVFPVNAEALERIEKIDSDIKKDMEVLDELESVSSEEEEEDAPPIFDKTSFIEEDLSTFDVPLDDEAQVEKHTLDDDLVADISISDLEAEDIEELSDAVEDENIEELSDAVEDEIMTLEELDVDNDESEFDEAEEAEEVEEDTVHLDTATLNVDKLTFDALKKSQEDALQDAVPLEEDEKPASDSSALFKELRSLCEFLPVDKRNQFMQSLAYVQLEYVISKLAGREGLLNKSSNIRKKSAFSSLSRKNEKSVSLTGCKLAIEVIDIASIVKLTSE